MADIILKGRDTSGNLVDNVYEGIDIISVKNSDEEDTYFYNNPYRLMNHYIMQPVEGADGNNNFQVVDTFTKISGNIGAYAAVNGDDFEKYKTEGSFGGQLMICITMKTLTIGEIYKPIDLILQE